MRILTLAALGVVALVNAEAGAATLFSGFSAPTYATGSTLEGQDGWSVSTSFQGAQIGSVVEDDGFGGQAAVLGNQEPDTSAYGVWTRPLTGTSDQFFSVSWQQAVTGNANADFGVVLYDGTTPVASIGMGPSAGWHQFQIDVDFTTGSVTRFVDGAVYDMFQAPAAAHTVGTLGLYTQSDQGYGYFENMTVVSSVPEPGILAIGVASAVLALPRRRAAMKA